jgi:hypothetical protein
VLQEYELYGSVVHKSKQEVENELEQGRHKPGSKPWHSVEELKAFVSDLENEKGISADELSDSKLAEELVDGGYVLWTVRTTRKKIATLRRG